MAAQVCPWWREIIPRQRQGQSVNNLKVDTSLKKKGVTLKISFSLRIIGDLGVRIFLSGDCSEESYRESHLSLPHLAPLCPGRCHGKGLYLLVTLICLATDNEVENIVCLSFISGVWLSSFIVFVFFVRPALYYCHVLLNSRIGGVSPIYSRQDLYLLKILVVFDLSNL
uniref:Uncharacterized protein n=1 Tax=Solanum lycopersicum TaxID=4081 RepID=A0A3Q7G8L9_SOLLC